MKKTLLTLTMFVASIAIVSSQTILLEDFESGALPTGWTRTQNTPSAGWEFGTSTAMSSQYWPIPAHTKIAASNDDKHDNTAATQNLANLDFLISPSMDFSVLGSVFMEFAVFFDGQYGSTAHVKVSTDAGLTWTNLSTLTAQSTWQTLVVNLSAYASNNDVMVA
ncbi:MAG: choice-of-anchor J domain-containing protein, partial [Bacteroidota bacterium]|nr:choice-of-anchor J domain-containing protein [Bacteroidota bacterium]